MTDPATDDLPYLCAYGCVVWGDPFMHDQCHDEWENEVTKDPNSYIQASAETLAETLLSKNSDYAPTGEFSNFEKAAEVAGIGVFQVIAAQAAIKMTRIESLMGTRGNPKVVGESLKDSFLDLAGYAIIAHAYLEFRDVPQKSELKGVLNDVLVTDREIIRNLADEDQSSHFEDAWHRHTWVTAESGDGSPIPPMTICGICGERRDW
jgi:hypothetical protein